jgi:hypothetical protein
MGIKSAMEHFLPSPRQGFRACGNLATSVTLSSVQLALKRLASVGPDLKNADLADGAVRCNGVTA